MSKDKELGAMSTSNWVVPSNCTDDGEPRAEHEGLLPPHEVSDESEADLADDAANQGGGRENAFDVVADHV